jgi:hypothetical protein
MLRVDYFSKPSKVFLPVAKHALVELVGSEELLLGLPS